jgi:hypothetical protein
MLDRHRYPSGLETPFGQCCLWKEIDCENRL